MIKFKCAACGMALRAALADASKILACPKCSAEVLVPVVQDDPVADRSVLDQRTNETAMKNMLLEMQKQTRHLAKINDSTRMLAWFVLLAMIFATAASVLLSIFG